MSVLDIEIDGELLDLYEDEDIVQSFTILNIEDITKRQSEYSNEFKAPKTNKNISIIGYANYLNSNNNFPYLKKPCTIKLNSFVFKTGFVELTGIDESLSFRFYTGNIGFYNILKNRRLNQLRLEDLDHTWDLSTVVSSRTNTDGYLYPLIDYGDMSTTGNTVDVRQLLAAYFDSTLMEACCTENGYTLVNQLSGSDLDEYNTGLVPTAIKNPAIPNDILLANVYEGIYIEDNDFNGQTFFNLTQGASFTWVNGTYPLKACIPLNNPSNLYDIGNYINGQFGTGVFTAAYSGLYKITQGFNWMYSWNENFTSTPTRSTNVYLTVDIYVNGTPVENVFTYSYTETSFNPNGYDFTDILSSTKYVFLNAGDQMDVRFAATHNTTLGYFSGAINLFTSGFFFINPNSNDLLIELQPEVQFNTSVQASFFLPEMTQADYFKDTLIRYCIVPFVDEDNKVVTLRQFSDIKNNIPNAVDWTNKVDQTNYDKITFSLGNYCQKNNFKHKFDKSINAIPTGSDFVLSINNQNLPYEGDIYESPFAYSEMVTRLSTTQMANIDLYNTTTSSFDKDVEPRRLYVEKISRTIDYTDGTTTSTQTTDIPVTWFIRSDKDYNMGFGNNQLNRYSSDLISVLQNLKIVDIDIRLNIIDIMNLNYFYPVYLNQYNAYFFISTIQQFKYTRNESTSVVLIKLN